MPKDPVSLPEASPTLPADDGSTSKSNLNELAEIPQKGTDKQLVATLTAGTSSANDLPSVSSSLATSGSASGNPADALSNGATTTTTTTTPVSKKQLKRAQRYEKKMEIKKRRKLQDKEVKEANAKAQGRDLERVREEQAAARALAAAGHNNNNNRQKNRWEQIHGPLLERSFQVCVDCAFAEQMTAKEIGSLAIQLRYCYSENRHNPHPCRLAATSVTGATLGHLQNVAGFAEWGRRGFTVTSDSMEQYYGLPEAGPATDEHEQADDDDDRQKRGNLDNVVYLTSDSDTVLHDLDDTKIYVIGGIVDRNRLRRATLDRATALGVATARLPIDEHLELGGVTRVLTVNSVFELLLQFRQHNRDWKKALLHVLPPRKNAQQHQVEQKKQSRCSSDSSKDEPLQSNEGAKGGDASASLVGAGFDCEVGQNVARSCKSCAVD